MASIVKESVEEGLETLAEDKESTGQTSIAFSYLKGHPISDTDRAHSPALSFAGSSSGVSSMDKNEAGSSRCSNRSSSSCSLTPTTNELQSSVGQRGGLSACMYEDLADGSKSPSSVSQENEVGPHLVPRWKQTDMMSAMGLPLSFGTSKAVKRKYSEPSQHDSDVDSIVDTCFSKRFRFEPANWKLPDSVDMFSSNPWKLPNFLDLKNKLNAVKDELNDLPLQDWHAHTRRRNKAGNIIFQLRKKINPELPTQAWCKFYENCSSLPLIPQIAKDNRCLNSVHLCEAPGAFVTSLNHYLHSHFGENFKFDWRAVTLNPYYEGNPLSCMINDDRLILQTLDKWLFGKDNTGDLMNKDNLFNILEHASCMGDIHLVTADGSIDCQDNPAEQEDIVSWLHYCETIAALKLLAPGGSFLIKMFTFYEHFSICLMYLLNCVFKSVTVNKPVTSKEGNSEVYVVCCGYIGLQNIAPWMDTFLKSYGPNAPKETLFALESIPHSFLDQLYKCADLFRKFQTDVIMENIRSYHNPVGKDSYITAMTRHRVAQTFFQFHNIKKIDRSLYLVDSKKLVDLATPNIDPRQEEGSFNDRRKRMALSPVEELKYLEDDLDHLRVAWPGDFDVFWMEFPDKPKGFKIIKGRPVTKVNSSKFCLGRLLKIRNRVREVASGNFKAKVLQVTSKSDSRKILWPNSSETITQRNVVTMDFKNELWASLEDGSNAINEKGACKKILSVIEHDVFRDDCLELRGFPLLTQFNVGLIYLLGHLFEQVGFVRPDGQDIRIRFYKYKKFNPEMKRHWDEVVSVMDQDCEAVLSVVQISELSDGDFYKYVLEINNLCVVEQIRDLLRAMSAY